MIMKKLVSFILILSLCLTLTACGTGYEERFVAFAAPALNLRYTDYLQDGYDSFLDKLDGFAAKLTEETYADSDKESNICISPVSVYMALALATECASGETRDEILNAVGVTHDEVKSFTKFLYARLNREFTAPGKKNIEQVVGFAELANSIWADNDIKLSASGINNLANDYHCDLFSVNFGNGEGGKVIRDYIKDKTHGIIDDEISFSTETLITLINTFYLKDIWSDLGEPLKFTDYTYDFKNADGSITATKLLKGRYFRGNIYEGNGYTSFYTTTENGFSIRFIVPADGYTLDEVFTAENLYNVVSMDDYGYVDEENKLLHNTRVFFPEYAASFNGDIKDILKKDFKINKLFDLNECDFSNITDANIACDGVIHKCSIEVTAEGIEGAAVTIMPLCGAAGPMEGYENVYHDYIVDRAFGFVITDNLGSVVFSGAVNSVD